VRFTALLALLPLLACNTLHVERQSSCVPGSVLVLPPHDATYQGAPHPKGAGTGDRLEHSLVEDFAKTPFHATLTTNPAFQHTKSVDPAAALAEAKRLGSAYCLILELGEFHDAGPMTFRRDYMTLQSGVMYAVATGAEVWRVTQPLAVSKTNLGSCDSLVTGLAKIIVTSITGTQPEDGTKVAVNRSPPTE
jgi:hypothetical protein